MTWATHEPLPDETRVSVRDGFGDTRAMTLGDVRRTWKDAGHFAIDWSLRTRGVWKSLGLTVSLGAQ